MAYSAITTEEVTSGKPTRAEVGTKIKDNFDDHETRISALESAGVGQAIIDWSIHGVLDSAYTQNGALYYRINENINVLGVKVQVAAAGASGTLEVDVKYKRGAAAFATILSSTVTITSASGDFALASGTLSTTELNVGDIIRLDIISVQDQMDGIYVYFEKEVR